MDPTLIYLLLMVGLWLGATSFLIPGTGLAELGAVVLLGGAFWGLAQLPTNWSAVLVLISGLAVFILLPLLRPRLAPYAEFALVAQGGASFFLFDGMSAGAVAIGAVMVTAFAYNRMLLMPLINRMEEMPAAGNESEMLLGATGRVTSALEPPQAGSAHINGESWTIRAGEPLEPGDLVQVVDVKGLEARVERVKAKRLPTPAEHIDR